MKIQFSKLEIQYDPEKMGNEILKILSSINIKEYHAQIGCSTATSEECKSSFFEVGGSDIESLLSTIEAVIKYEKANSKSK